MQRLWLANIAPGTSDGELKELIKRYAPDLECIDIQRVDGSGERPAAWMTFSGTDLGSLGKLQLRLSGMHWKGRALTCGTTMT